MYWCFESLCQTRISNWIHNISMKMDIYSNISEVTIFLWNNSPGYCNISPTPSLIWRNHHHLTAPSPVLCAWLLHFVYRYHCSLFSVHCVSGCSVSSVHGVCLCGDSHQLRRSSSPLSVVSSCSSGRHSHTDRYLPSPCQCLLQSFVKSLSMSAAAVPGPLCPK